MIVFVDIEGIINKKDYYIFFYIITSTFVFDTTPT